MEGNNKAIIRFKNRAASNISDKGVQEQYSDGGPFDVDLHTSDGKCVSAHRFVLVMFSKVWAIALRHAGIDGVISSKSWSKIEFGFFLSDWAHFMWLFLHIHLTFHTVPIDLPLHLAKKLVELLYFREVQVLQSEKETLLTAVRVYKIAGIEDEAKALAKGNWYSTISMQFRGRNAFKYKITFTQFFFPFRRQNWKRPCKMNKQLQHACRPDVWCAHNPCKLVVTQLIALSLKIATHSILGFCLIVCRFIVGLSHRHIKSKRRFNVVQAPLEILWILWVHSKCQRKWAWQKSAQQMQTMVAKCKWHRIDNRHHDNNQLKWSHQIDNQFKIKRCQCIR